jgi:hypothetical protein
MHSARIPLVVFLSLAVATGCRDDLLSPATAPTWPSLAHVAGHCEVTTLDDGGAGSLRAAIDDGSCSNITFGVSGVVTLTSGQLTISRYLTINGPGADQLTVARSAADGTPAFRIFQVVERVGGTISGLTISNGLSSSSGGGGILNFGGLVVHEVAITGNVAGGDFASGGGIENFGTVWLTSSTVSGNSAPGLGSLGGGISSRYDLLVVNSTISGNSSWSRGGGIWSNGRVAVRSSTVVDNISYGGGGIETSFSILTLVNSIVARNTASYEAPDVYGYVSAVNSVIGNTQSAISFDPWHSNITNVASAALYIGPLADNGGPTRTHALLSGSPAIGAGANAECTALDQRGYARVRTEADPCDIGAFEFEAVLPVDVTPPAISAEITGTLGSNDWYTSAVTINWTVQDAESEVSTTTGCAQTTISTDTDGTTLSCEATSLGGTVSESVTIKRDATAPTLSPSVSPNPVLLNGAATASPNAADAMSGVASASCATPPTGSTGNKFVACTATDNAGNSANANASYTVQFGFAGFDSPVMNDGFLNVARAGRSIALKWRLLDAGGSPVTTLSSVQVTAVNFACSVEETANNLEEYAAGSSGLQNLGDGYYQYNWASSKSYAGSCKTLRLNLGEGGFRTALFQFTR